MAEARSIRLGSVSQTANLVLGLLLTVTGLLSEAEANSIRVTPAAALDGSRFGLELGLADPASRTPTDAYVAIGPDKGVQDETALEVGFVLDPTGLVRAKRRRPGALNFLRLADGPGRGGLVVSIERIRWNLWSIGAWSWDDTTGGFVLAGRAPLRLEVRRRLGRFSRRCHVEVEWAAASEAEGRARGYVRILSVASDGDRALLLENTELNNASQRVGYVELGVRAADHAPGVAGSLFIDNFQVNRTSPALP